jgi:uncharacterized membrane protein
MQFVKSLRRSFLFWSTCYALFLWAVHTLDPSLGTMRNAGNIVDTYSKLAESTWYWYLIPNLILGMIPLFLASLLLRGKRVQIKELFILTVWLLFLPNSFYVVTDFIHAQESGIPNLFHVMLLALFSVLAWVYGLLSMRLVEQFLQRSLRNFNARIFVVAISFLCSVAIFLGRDLRLNSWDIFVRPLSLVLGFSGLFDPSVWGLLAGRVLVFTPLIGLSYSSWRKLKV